jgi:pyrophosphate--fructose-6-phosphate 1-phosphotransferase
LFDGLQALHAGSRLIGFLGGPRGILENRGRELTAEALAPFRNTGGFDLLGAGRDKIETPEQLVAARKTCEQLGLGGLLIIGGDDSNTNAAVLAESFLEAGVDIPVVGVPKTIDGDLKGGPVELPFGFDTATKIYSGQIGDICRDALSAGKYWHFVKLMGRSASHVTLECALQTHPNITLIGEEVREKGLTLEQIVERIATTVRRRAEAGKHHGVCLVPEGLIEFVPEIQALIASLNGILSAGANELAAIGSPAEQRAWVERKLSVAERRVFGSLPEEIAQQLLIGRDSHGNVQVSKIDTQRLLSGQVARRIDAWRAAGEFDGAFSVQEHFFGYEGRCAAPSDFDANYAYALGRLASVLVAAGRTGYMCCMGKLAGPADRWEAAGVPQTALMRIETRKGRQTPVIAKALVRTDREPFATFAAARDRWAIDDAYRYPGAIQYFGPGEISAAVTRTLELERPVAGITR